MGRERSVRSGGLGQIESPRGSLERCAGRQVKVRKDLGSDRGIIERTIRKHVQTSAERLETLAAGATAH